MPSPLLENLSSLVFPVECEICGIVLNPDPPSGVCKKCADSVHRIGAPHCAGCGRTLKNILFPCASCQNESFAFDEAFACAYYEGVMRELLHTYKFDHRKYLKHFFTDMMKEFIHTHLSGRAFDAVLSVPAAPEKRLERGFNPPELISKEIAQDMEIPHLSRELVRVRAEVAQSLLAKPGRKENVKGVFFVKHAEMLRSKRLLLIDDILTTGETASECARTLKKAGASSVTVLALARGA